MGRVTEFVFRKLTIRGKGSYNTATGVIQHAPKGEGKINIKSKTKTTKK